VHHYIIAVSEAAASLRTVEWWGGVEMLQDRIDEWEHWLTTYDKNVMREG
jgi:hypothetical protein